jgi:hypothetical protein
MTRRLRTMSSLCSAYTSSSLFPFWRLDANGGEDSYLYLSFFIFFLQCVMDLSSTCDGRVDKNLFMCGL